MTTTTQDDFNVPIPTDDLDRKPDFLIPAGWYESTLQAGTENVVGSKTDAAGAPVWRGIRVPFAGFASKKEPGKSFDRSRNFQITTHSTNDKAKQIGREQLTAVAVAFGLAEDTTVAGKPAKRMTASNAEELASQLNDVAGSPCDVYVSVKKRTRDGKPVMRDDGQGPVMDNEISRVAAYGTGK